MIATSANIYEEIGKPRGTAAVLTQFGVLAAKNRLLDEADRCFSDALVQFKKLGDLRGQLICTLNMHANAVWRGDKLGSLELAERGLALANETDSPPLQSWALMCFGGAQRDLRNFDDAISALEEARTIIETLEAPPDIYEVKTELALAHLMAGHTGLARSLTEECLAFAQSQPFDVGVPEHLYWLAARVYRASGDAKRATEFLDRAFESVESAARDMDSPSKRDAFMNLGVSREIIDAHEQNNWPDYAGREQPSVNLA